MQSFGGYTACDITFAKILESLLQKYLKKFGNKIYSRYLCSVPFDRLKTKADNDMSGRFAQNRSKS